MDWAGLKFVTILLLLSHECLRLCLCNFNFIHTILHTVICELQKSYVKAKAKAKEAKCMCRCI